LLFERLLIDQCVPVDLARRKLQKGWENRTLGAKRRTVGKTTLSQRKKAEARKEVAERKKKEGADEVLPRLFGRAFSRHRHARQKSLDEKQDDREEKGELGSLCHRAYGCAHMSILNRRGEADGTSFNSPRCSFCVTRAWT
jgi:hypothetical protein